MTKHAKLKAALIGYGIGDAMGKGTEFMTLPEVRFRYPQGLRKYSEIFQDAHRSQWAPNEWTNDTEILLRMARTMVDNQGKLHLPSQATMLKEWFDTDPVDTVPCMRWVLSQPDYLQHPIQTAKRVWDQMEHLEASNEALGRAFLAGLAPGMPEMNARNMTLLTHSDPQCEAMGVIVGRMAYDLFETSRPTTRDSMLSIVREIAPDMLEYVGQMLGADPSRLELDDVDTSMSAMKSALAAIWAAQKCRSAEEALYTLIDCGGDADTFASLALAFIGLKEGRLDLPSHLVEELDRVEELFEVADDLSEAWGNE